MAEPETRGEGGGRILDRTQLRLIEKQADRYPLTDDERLEMVMYGLETMRNTKSLRTRLQAIRTLSALDKNNLEFRKHQEGENVNVNHSGTVTLEEHRKFWMEVRTVLGQNAALDAALERLLCERAGLPAPNGATNGHA